ncbi:MAG: hypothetical protein K0Q52_129 [Microbacterium sp.]|jgi:hypothetical protein|nr:hypothetical protein [Microbacterium sp.]
MTVRFANGAYCKASGTRDAFGRASDQLEREGHPAITIISGDREYEDQKRIFLERYVTAGNIRGRRVYDTRKWLGVTWYRISAAGTVAVPGTSNHESRRAADLAAPYNNRHSAAHRRLQQIAAQYGLKWTGINFSEDWHWEFLGLLGSIGFAAGAAAQTPETDGDDLNETQNYKLDAVFEALVAKPAGGGMYYKTDAMIGVMRDEIGKAIASIAAGNINFPGANYNAFVAIVNTIREGNGQPALDIDEATLAKSLAPALAPLLLSEGFGQVDDETVARIAKAAADEQSKRLAA